MMEIKVLCIKEQNVFNNLANQFRYVNDGLD